jgi:hypothetical protein
LQPSKQPANKEKKLKIVAVVPTDRLQAFKETKQRNS